MKSFLIYSIVDCIVNSLSQRISNKIRISSANINNWPKLCENTLYRFVVVRDITYINVFVSSAIYNHEINDYCYCISYDHNSSIHGELMEMIRGCDILVDKDIVKYKIL